MACGPPGLLGLSFDSQLLTRMSLLELRKILAQALVGMELYSLVLVFLVLGAWHCSRVRWRLTKNWRSLPCLLKVMEMGVVGGAVGFQ